VRQAVAREKSPSHPPWATWIPTAAGAPVTAGPSRHRSLRRTAHDRPAGQAPVPTELRAAGARARVTPQAHTATAAAPSPHGDTHRPVATQQRPVNDHEPPRRAARVTINRRRPTLPGPCEPSTIGAERLNFSVRNGKRCFPLAKATGNSRESRRPLKTAQLTTWVIHADEEKIKPSSPRAISTSLLHALPRVQIWPINLVVSQGSYSLKGMGELILRPASRLDAFSGYPIRT
jgi:hypothetical protein